MTELSEKSCRPVAKETAPLKADSAQKLLQHISNWALSADNKVIQCEFRFKNYYQTMAFVNAMAWIAHQEDHHPDMEVSYNLCRINFSTHSIGGLSENDFICAAKINLLLQNT